MGRVNGSLKFSSGQLLLPTAGNPSIQSWAWLKQDGISLARSVGERGTYLLNDPAPKVGTGKDGEGAVVCVQGVEQAFLGTRKVIQPPISSRSLLMKAQKIILSAQTHPTSSYEVHLAPARLMSFITAPQTISGDTVMLEVPALPTRLSLARQPRVSTLALGLSFPS